MSRRLLAIAIAIFAGALAVGLVGCGEDTADEAGQAADTATKATNNAKEKTSQAVTKVTGGHVSVAMSDFKFAPAKLTTSARRLKVTAKNAGQQQHEFVLLRTDKAPDAIPLKGSEASEASSVGEISEQQPGQGATHSFRLKPGNYVFICNVDGHYKLGMRGALVVE
jgi:uncharacterized cupredoxin-like copper-binding protein